MTPVRLEPVTPRSRVKHSLRSNQRDRQSAILYVYIRNIAVKLFLFGPVVQEMVDFSSGGHFQRIVAVICNLVRGIFQ